MAYTGTGVLGTTLIGQGSGRGGTFSPIGTSSGLTTHGILLSQGLGAFTAITPSSTSGTVVQSRGAASDPQYSTAAYPITAGTSGNVITSDGTNFVSQAAASSGFTTVVTQVFTSDGTYTPTANMKYCIIECVGGGGGAGGVANAAATNIAVSGGGGGGGYARKSVAAATVGMSQTVSIGAAGSAGTNAPGNGGTGGTTSVGTICVATGGSGSAGSGAFVTVFLCVSNGGAGGVGTTGDILVNGGPGIAGIGSGTSNNLSAGNGGNSYFGGGGLGTITSSTGSAGTNYGGGGGGSGSVNGNGAQPGVAGAKGVVIITEFI